MATVTIPVRFQGGPLDGQTVEVRAGNVLVVDRPAHAAYVYDFHDGALHIRKGYEEGLLLDDARRVATAERDGWDVIAWTADG